MINNDQTIAYAPGEAWTTPPTPINHQVTRPITAAPERHHHAAPAPTPATLLLRSLRRATAFIPGRPPADLIMPEIKAIRPASMYFPSIRVPHKYKCGDTQHLSGRPFSGGLPVQKPYRDSRAAPPQRWTAHHNDRGAIRRRYYFTLVCYGSNSVLRASGSRYRQP